MIIREFYYNEDSRTLNIQFSTKEDGDDFYREVELEYWEIEYYSPDIITKSILKKLDKEYVKEIINQFLKKNELPEQETL